MSVARMPAATPGARTGGTLALVARLLGALDEAGVRYCHWKSNEALQRSASGENDLDLLVAREHARRFCGVVSGLGFVLARPRAGRQLPGVVDFYGGDGATGRTVHVHAHYQLVLGDDTTKNVRLPIEEAYLRSVRRDGLFPVPAPEFEYAVFVLRMVLKHATWDAQAARAGRLTVSERRERAYLLERADAGVVRSVVTAHLPFVGWRAFRACEMAVADGAGHLRRALAAARLLRALRAHGRRGRRADLALRVSRRAWRRLEARLSGHGARKRLGAGGLLVAVVGGDGAGKTSVVESVTGLFARDFDTRRFHLGKPPRSLLTRAVRRPLTKLRAVGWFSATTLPPWHELRAYPGLGFLVWHTLTARDRLREYERARRHALRGGIALCDRYPTTGLRLMDGPRTGGVPGLARRPWARWLAAREAACYTDILPPDLLVVLRLPPAEAVARRPEQDAEFVRRRAAEVFEATWDGRAVVIDATATKEAVHQRVAAAVWGAL